MARLADLEEEKTQRLRDLEEERDRMLNWVKELVDAGGYSAARDRGIVRTEGRGYVVRDGDVITIRH